MRMEQEKVSTRRRATTIALNDQERQDLQRLGQLKYHDMPGMTTVLREEGMKAVREELARLDVGRGKKTRAAA